MPKCLNENMLHVYILFELVCCMIVLKLNFQCKVVEYLATSVSHKNAPVGKYEVLRMYFICTYLRA